MMSPAKPTEIVNAIEIMQLVFASIYSLTFWVDHPLLLLFVLATVNVLS